MRLGLAVLTLAFLYGTMTGVFGQRVIDHRVHDGVRAQIRDAREDAHGVR